MGTAKHVLNLSAHVAVLGPSNSAWLDLLFSIFHVAGAHLQVPGCRDMRPAVAPDCNVASWLDSKVLKPQHMCASPHHLPEQPRQQWSSIRKHSFR